MRWLRYSLWAIAAACTVVGFLMPAEPYLYWAIVGLVLSGTLGIILQVRNLLAADRAGGNSAPKPGSGTHGPETRD